MKKRLSAVVLAVAIAVGGTVAAAPAADAAVPYSWWCHRGGYRDVHVWTPASVGFWTARMGYRCYGGRWVNV